MTRKQFESLVTRLERKANDQMKSYTLKVALLAAGGYVYVVLILALMVAAVSGPSGVGSDQRRRRGLDACVYGN